MGSTRTLLSILKVYGTLRFTQIPHRHLYNPALCGPLATIRVSKAPVPFCGMSRLLIFLRVSWVSLAGCGAGEEEVAFAGVAGKGGGAFELGAGFGVAA
jgi:hypothetical protein